MENRGEQRRGEKLTKMHPSLEREKRTKKMKDEEKKRFEVHLPFIQIIDSKSIHVVELITKKNVTHFSTALSMCISGGVQSLTCVNSELILRASQQKTNA